MRLFKALQWQGRSVTGTLSKPAIISVRLRYAGNQYRFLLTEPPIFPIDRGDLGRKMATEHYVPKARPFMPNLPIPDAKGRAGCHKQLTIIRVYKRRLLSSLTCLGHVMGFLGEDFGCSRWYWRCRARQPLSRYRGRRWCSTEQSLIRRGHRIRAVMRSALNAEAKASIAIYSEVLDLARFIPRNMRTFCAPISVRNIATSRSASLSFMDHRRSIFHAMRAEMWPTVPVVFASVEAGTVRD